MPTGAKPSAAFTWATSPGSNQVTNPGGLLTTGYANSSTPDAGDWNWLWNVTGAWLTWANGAEFGYLDATSQTWSGTQLISVADDGSGANVQTNEASLSSVFLHTDGSTAGAIAWNAYYSAGSYYSFSATTGAYRLFWDSTTGDLIYQNAAGEASGTALTWYNSLKISTTGIDSPQISENGTSLASKYLAITTAASTYLTQTAAAADYLGIGAQAADSAKLGGVAAAGYALVGGDASQDFQAKSLTLPGSGNAGVTSNKIATYEEGTFSVTPTGVSGTPAAATWAYVQIGKLVTIRPDTSSYTAAGGDIAFQLPASLKPSTAQYVYTSVDVGLVQQPVSVEIDTSGIAHVFSSDHNGGWNSGNTFQMESGSFSYVLN